MPGVSASEDFFGSVAVNGISNANSELAGGSQEQPSAEGAGPPAPAGATAPEAEAALSVTRLACFTKQKSWKPLACGVDSLDVGLEVVWGNDWPEFSNWLEATKLRAAGSDGVPSLDGRYLILPSAKPPNYRWHLQWPDFHLFLANSQSPKRSTPNVYVSINSKALWTSSPALAVSAVVQEIIKLGGSLHRVKISRCDLAVDLLIPGGISLPLLLKTRVPNHVKHSHHMTGDQLESFYHGAKQSPIQLRVYDKALEVSHGGTKYWFYDIWKVAPGSDVWRVEFQLRRSSLKEFGINSIPDLVARAGGLWQYLTNDWFSLRLDDDSNVTRCTILPGWATVQACACRFGQELSINRNVKGDAASAEWYVSHCAGCLAGFGARLRLADFESAAAELLTRMRTYWGHHDYEREYGIRSIQLGFSVKCKSKTETQVLKETESIQ